MEWWVGLNWIGLERGGNISEEEIQIEEKEGRKGVLVEEDEIWCCVYICRERKGGGGSCNGLIVANRAIRESEANTVKTKSETILLRYCLTG